MTETAEDDRMTATGRWRRPSLGSVIGSLTIAWGALVAAFPLDDNSFFTHLATGRLILANGSVPTSDPYTFTALGEAWVVQSWLPATAYAGAEQLAGALGLRALALAIFASAGALLWRLSRPSPTLIGRLALVAVALLVSTPMWSMRPYMVGVTGLAVVLLAADGLVRPLFLVPLMWVWANSHGSYPFAVAALLLVMIGKRFDRMAVDHERRVLVHVLAGIALGVVGPLGIDVLTFPLFALERSDVLAEVIEWQAPDYRGLGDRAYLVLVAGTMVALVRSRSWRDALPAVVFVCAGLLAQRNIVIAVVVLVPVIARALPARGAIRSSDRPRFALPLLVAAVALASLAGIVAMTTPTRALSPYPDEALAWLAEQHIDRRIAHPVATGNLLEALDGATGEVFIDDRFDMFPDAVLDDALALTRARQSWQQVLTRRGIDTVVWRRAEPLASLLSESERWAIRYSDAEWIVATRRE